MWTDNPGPDRETDRHNEANSRFSQIFERAYKRQSAYLYVSTNTVYLSISCLSHDPFVSTQKICRFKAVDYPLTPFNGSQNGSCFVA